MSNKAYSAHRKSQHSAHHSHHRHYSHRLTFPHYHHEHGSFDPSTAATWASSLDEDNRKQLLVEAAFAKQHEWVDVLQKSLKGHRVEMSEDIFHAITQDRPDVLTVLLPSATTTSMHQLITHALQKGYVECVDLMLPCVKPKSQASQLLQQAASDNISSAMLGMLVSVSEPAKAARHLIYRSQPKPADVILSHPNTPIDLLRGVIEYAHSRQLSLPTAQARLSHHDLQQAVSDQKRSIAIMDTHQDSSARRKI